MTSIYIKQDTILPERRKNDFYTTPLSFAKAALDHLPKDFHPNNIIDPGAGSGIWGQAAHEKWTHGSLHGYEIRDIEAPDHYHFWWKKDFLERNVPGWGDKFELVMGNPPYSHAEEIIRYAMYYLREGGYLVFMLRLAFLESKKRLKLWEDCPLKKVVVCANRPSFTGNGKTNATAFAFFYWKKGYQGSTDLSWTYVEKEILEEGRREE